MPSAKCANWTRGNRKEDMTLEEISRVFDSPLWKNIEVAFVSGGEPTTRNDLVDICKLMLDKLPRLRKFGINTTGLTPKRGIPMLTKIAELCHERGVIFSTRVSIDGIGDMHDQVRKVKRGFDKAQQTITAMRELQKRVPFNFGISTTIFSMNLDDADNILQWARRRSSTSSSTWCGSRNRCWAMRIWSDASQSAKKKSGCASSSWIACGWIRYWTARTTSTCTTRT